MTNESGYLTKFLRWDGISAYIQIAGVIDMEPPEKSREVYETTNLDGTSVGGGTGHKIFRGALIDSGEMSLTLAFDEADAGQVALHTDMDNSVPEKYEIEYSDGSKVDFEALVTGMGGAVPIEDRVTRTVSFKLSGAWTVTPAP